MTELERARIEEASKRHAYISKRHNPTTVLAIFDDLTVEGWKPPVNPDIAALRPLWVEMMKNSEYTLSVEFNRDVLAGLMDDELQKRYLPFYLAGKNDRSNNFG